ncbi:MULTISPECIES: hypothetical protein [unclassified Sphingopyxis]|jgi:hypothetical protein|uniref:hypothetical protein n=1 Tax=unclassified Sphingopyxis TaxID=2614943 RepID=UPI0006C1BA98|nr:MULTISPECIES: hypothetical protein [unclassified Sphingopyxis]USI76205.1 hypothetical protein KEC45_15725 [Sphingopyxis sp. USTB-05]GAO77088.1 hypothetical protein SC1_00377 [Sphingopyxis sp. C-1]
MAKRRSKSAEGDASIANISRTRRAQLVAEFEGELGIDHKARAKAAEAERRWIARKTFIVWTIAAMFFAIACQKLWLMGEDVDVPFSDINPVRSLFGE